MTNKQNKNIEFIQLIFPSILPFPVSSGLLSGVWGEAPAANDFGVF